MNQTRIPPAERPPAYDKEYAGKRLDYLYSAYYNLVRKLAVEVFEAKVKPFLLSKGYRMVVKDGINYLYQKSGSKWVDMDASTLPRWLLDLLNLDIPGKQDPGIETLGEFMPDFNPDEKDK